MRLILALDNDQAGQLATQRFLEGHVSEIDLPLPGPDEMGMTAYRLWLRTLNVTELLNELIRLRDSEYAGADKAKAVEDELVFCKKSLAHAQHRNKYLEALKGL